MTENDDDFISKTQRKKAMHDLQALGEKLIALSAKDLDRLPVSDRFKAAWAEARRVSGREAMRRHMQFVGKVMRDEDADAIVDRMEQLDPANLAARAERWRELLLGDDANAQLEQFLTEQPLADRQQMRNLQRNAMREKADIEAAIASGQAPSQALAARKLFQAIKDVLIQQTL